jgi:hypothetical protein
LKVYEFSTSGGKRLLSLLPVANDALDEHIKPIAVFPAIEFQAAINP